MEDTAFLRALEASLSACFGGEVTVTSAVQLGGGASKESWSVDARTALNDGGEAPPSPGAPRAALNDGGESAPRALVVRRAGGGVIYSETLSLADEHTVVAAAHRAGALAPRTYGHVPDLLGKEAFVMERLPGESIGRRVVTKPELAAARAKLPEQMAEQLAKIHAISADDLPFLPGRNAADAADRTIQRLYEELDGLKEPHPAIEWGLLWLRQNKVSPSGHVVLHGDFRIGNLLVVPGGLSGVIDWEFAHVGDPAEDLAWPLVRAWRFGKDRERLGGIGPITGYLAAYNAASGRQIREEQLFYWEVMGNIKWAVGSLTQARRHLNGQERSVELASLGRLAAEVEMEIVSLVERASAGGSR